MKSKIFILFIFFAGFVILLTTGCKKDVKTTKTDMQVLPAAQYQRDMKFARMYTAFKQKGSQKLKDGEEMTIDSAISYLEGTANMTYGYAFFETSQTEVDSTFIRLTLTDNKVTLNEVWKKYSDMIDSIRASYKKIDQSVKQLISVQVEMHGQSLTQVVCKVTSIFGIRSVLPDFCTFNDVDWWTWWNWTGQGGICGGPNNNGQGDGLDAAQLINQKIMNCRGIYPGYRYWTDQESVVLEPESYHNLNWGGVDYNYEQYLLYWNHSDYSNFHGCLSPDECNFYLEGTKWVANTAHSQGGARPDNKSFISIAIYGDAVWDQPNLGDSKYLHHGPVYYGIWHYYTSPATALD